MRQILKLKIFIFTILYFPSVIIASAVLPDERLDSLNTFCKDIEKCIEIKIFSGSGSLSFDDIKKLPEDCFKFYQNEKLHADSTYWLKLNIENQSNHSGEYFLHFNGMVSNIELFQALSDSVIRKEKGGVLVPLSQRSHNGSIKDKVSFLLFENRETTLFLKIRNQLENVNVPGYLKIISKTDFEEKKADLNFLQGGFLGILVLLVIFNFILFIFSLNRLYLFYSLYIVSFVLFLANIFQLTERFLLANYPRIDIYTQWAYLVAEFIYLLFFIELLKIERVALWRKYINRFTLLMGTFLLLTVGISFFDYHKAMVLCDYYSLINIGFIIIAFIFFINKVRRTTKLILIGSVFTVLGAFTTIVLSFTESFIDNLIYFEIGVVIELIFFTMAINYTYTKNVQEMQIAIDKKENENISLKEEIDEKNRDLTTKALIIHEKEALLSNMIYQLSVLNESDKTSPNMKSLIAGLKHNLSNTPWSEVEIHFNKVQPQFYAALQEKCPTLTPNERKLCAFLKFNLSTKEIAAITGKSVNTIDVARSRLRKKMGLNESDNLQGYIANIAIPKN